MASTIFCTFRVDELYLGVDVLQVQEVLRSQQMTLVPLAEQTVRGLMNLRGQIVTHSISDGGWECPTVTMTRR